MPKEFRYEGMPSVYDYRPHYKHVGILLERDVSEWRPSPAESDVLRMLRALRAMPMLELSASLDVTFACVDNNYEKDAAILFYLIGAHGCAAVQDAVREMLGVDKLLTKES